MIINKLLLMIPILLSLSSCSKNPDPENYYPTKINCDDSAHLFYCPKVNKDWLQNNILKCSTSVMIGPNGGNYKDWDTSDYPDNLEACRTNVFIAGGCICD